MSVCADKKTKSQRNSHKFKKTLNAVLFHESLQQHLGFEQPAEMENESEQEKTTVTSFYSYNGNGISLTNIKGFRRFIAAS